jgi:hypothetical protein
MTAEKGLPAVTTERSLEALAAMPQAPPPPMSALLEAELAALAPVATRRPVRQLALFVLASLAYLGLLLGVLALRADLGDMPPAWMFGTGGAWLLGFALAAYFALVPRPGEMTPRWRAATATAALASVAFVVLGLAVHPAGPHSLHLGMAHLLRGRGCLWVGLATALVPVVLGAVFLRGALPVCSRRVAAAIGAAGGCLGGLVLHLHCRIADGPHIGLIHGGVVIVAAGLSAVLLPRATDRPYRS